MDEDLRELERAAVDDVMALQRLELERLRRGLWDRVLVLAPNLHWFRHATRGVRAGIHVVYVGGSGAARGHSWERTRITMVGVDVLLARVAPGVLLEELRWYRPLLVDVGIVYS